ARTPGRGRSKQIRLTFTVTNPTSFPAGSIMGQLNILTRRGRRKVAGTRTFRGNLPANGQEPFTSTFDPRKTLPGPSSALKGKNDWCLGEPAASAAGSHHLRCEVTPHQRHLHLHRQLP